MSRTARLLEILIVLRSRTRFTVQEMADEFGVSRRTMLRDLQAISEMGVPLSATPGPGGGYTLITKDRLLPLSLTVDEAIGIILSYESFLRYAQSPFAAQSLSAITKLRQSLPADVVRELDRVHTHVAIIDPERTYQAPHLGELLAASVDGVHLRIEYDSLSGLTERVIFPHGLYAAGGFWYCACHDYRRERLLDLRADRIKSIERVDGLDAPAPVSLRDWIAVRHSGPVEMLPFRARVTRTGARNIELHSLFGEIPTGEDGTALIEIEMPTSEIDWYASRLLTLGGEIVVESPPELVAAIKRQAAHILQTYGG